MMTHQWQPLSANDLAGLGVGEVVYFRRMEIEGEFVVAVYAADGEQLWVAGSESEAFHVAVDNELDPVSLH
ncbi:MAG: DUF1150 family protein [Rhodovibrionaceae bacterium]|nr:DUF1150 family protein [Rhodovibrionaceae bacterium]